MTLASFHMNGRLYDPHIARFMQADPYIQAPDNLQSFNRYSYILNNPLNGVDATGQFWFVWAFAAILTARALDIIDTRTMRVLLGITVGIALGNPQGALAAAMGKVGAAAVAGFVSGAISSGSIQGGIQGMASAMLFFGAGELGGPSFFNFAKEGFSLGRVALHAAAGCINAKLSGGNCGQGAATAGLTKAIGSALPDMKGNSIEAHAVNAVKYAIIGGTMSELGGGKFANGALTGAFQYMMNQAVSMNDGKTCVKGVCYDNSVCSYTASGQRCVSVETSPASRMTGNTRIKWEEPNWDDPTRTRDLFNVSDLLRGKAEVLAKILDVKVQDTLIFGVVEYEFQKGTSYSLVTRQDLVEVQSVRLGDIQWRNETFWERSKADLTIHKDRPARFCAHEFCIQ